MGRVVDSPLARAILRALAECWPDDADLGAVVIEDKGPRIVVTVTTSTPAW